MKMFFLGLTASLLSFSLLAGDVTSWQGHYERYHDGHIDADYAEITLVKLDSNKYTLSGMATWVGNPATGQINMGEIEGAVTLKGNQMHYDVDGCTLQIVLGSNSLSVSKDNGCGGLNVSFNGQYLKTDPNK